MFIKTVGSHIQPDEILTMCKPNRHPLGDHVCCFVYNCGIKHLEMWKNIKKQSIKQGKTLKKQIMYNIKIENHILDDEFGFFL